jgi:signal transduction histidine kinase
MVIFHPPDVDDGDMARDVPRSPTTRRLSRLVTGTVMFVAVGYLGRITVIDHGSVSLIWPAAGVAAVWVGSGNRQTWPADLLALAAASFLVNFATGAPGVVSAAFLVSNVLQVCTYVLLIRRWSPDLWGLGGSVPLHRLADLGRLVAAAVVACLVGAATGAAALTATVGGVEVQSIVVWWGRNCVSLVVIAILCLLVGPPLSAARTAGNLRRTLVAALRPHGLGRALEAMLLLATSVALCVALFGQRAAEPLSFLLLVLSVWAGLRFSPIAVMAHGLSMGAAGLLYTLHGNGLFAGIESEYYRALVAQVFIATTVLTGLALAFSRVERDTATRWLAAARRDADERARLLGAVLESMSEGLMVLDEGGRILVSNAASHRLLGTDGQSDELRLAAERTLFHDDGTPLGPDELPVLRVLAGDEVEPADYHLRADSVPGGRVLEIGARPLAPHDAEERPLAMMNIRDVTADRQHRDALASFAGVVAHDLFNPLTIVTGWTESLADEFATGPVPGSVGLPMVARVHEASNHMRHVIGDLLAYTVARDQSLRPADVDLTAEVRALALLRIDGPTAPTIAVAPGLRVWADAGLVRQLFDNLLGNAVKYVEPHVRPIVDVRGHRDAEWLEVRVSDNGIGIPEDQRELVFERFHRAHDSGYRGTGLGLAICRSIIDRHGGSIHAEAGPGGHGTTFVLRLPASSAGYAAPAQRPTVEQGMTARPVQHQPA